MCAIVHDAYFYQENLLRDKENFCIQKVPVVVDKLINYPLNMRAEYSFSGNNLKGFVAIQLCFDIDRSIYKQIVALGRSTSIKGGKLIINPDLSSNILNIVIVTTDPISSDANQEIATFSIKQKFDQNSLTLRSSQAIIKKPCTSAVHITNDGIQRSKQEKIRILRSGKISVPVPQEGRIQITEYRLDGACLQEFHSMGNLSGFIMFALKSNQSGGLIEIKSELSRKIYKFVSF